MTTVTIPLQTIGIDSIIAFFIPLIVALVKQQGLPNSWNGLISILCYVVFGVVGVVISGQPLTFANTVALWGIFQTIGTTAYQAFWKNTGVEPALTAATSVYRPAVVAGK